MKYSDQMKHRKKTYKAVAVDFKIDELEQFKAAVKSNGDTISGVFHRAVEEYMREYGGGNDETC